MSESNPMPPSEPSATGAASSAGGAASPDAPWSQPPERRLIVAPKADRSPLVTAFKDAVTLALDALDYAGDRVGERLSGARRTRK